MGRLTELPRRLGTLSTASVGAGPKSADAFYHSPEWRGLIKDIIAKRGRRCELCGRVGCRVYGDHRVELQDGGAPFDPANVQLLCGSCHQRKTIATRAKRQANRPRPPETPSPGDQP
jgi:5-methylcytosine-specific restriction endonuclease McrA